MHNLYRQEIINSELKSSSRLILHTLLVRADNETLIAFPSQETIAKEAGLSKPTVGKHTSNLENSGWLSITQRGRTSGGQGWRNEYELTFPPT